MLRGHAHAASQLATALVCLLVVLAGCRSSGIDPSGRRLFAGAPFGCDALSGVLPGPTTVDPGAVTVAPPSGVVVTPPPGAVAVAPPPTAAVVAPPSAVVVNPTPPGTVPLAGPPLGAATATASASAREPYRDYPGRQLPWDNVQIIVTPSRCVAPVGSDVVIMAGVLGPDNYLRTNERVEWMLSTDGPGEFVDFDRGTCTDLLLGDFTWPRKKDTHWVVTSTSRNYLRLNRETSTPTDDVNVSRGQTWVAVTSPVEGASHVVAYAPSVYGWNVRKQSATIHWVDAEWQFPPPAIVGAGGRHVFTTTVTRHTDHSPKAGWRVRYEVAGGVAAGFAPDGAASVEVVTNEAGQATAEIIQMQPAAGTTQVNVQVIRPSTVDGDNGKPLVVASGSTSVTWSAAQLAVQKTGPAVGSVGSTLSYRIAVTNTGDLPADDVTLVDEIPAGTELIGTRPQAEVVGGQIRWPIGRLEARQTREYEVDLRASQTGSLTSCAEVTAAGGLRGKGCATTVVGTSKVSIQILGPAAAAVGQTVNYEVVIANHGEVPATGLLIKVRFDAGLDHPDAESPIEKSLTDLSPGSGHRVGLTFRVTQAGSLCHEVEVTGAGGVLAKSRACLNATAGAAPPPSAPLATPPAGSRTTPQPPAGRPAVSVQKTGPATAVVGQLAKFTIVVQNTGDTPLTNVKIDDVCDAELVSTRATTGHQVTDRGVFWIVPSLPVGQQRSYSIECTCERTAAEAYNRVTVTTAEGAEARGEAPVEIRPAPAPAAEPPAAAPSATQRPVLSLAVMPMSYNVGVGGMITYDVLVENNSPYSDQGVVLEFDLAAGLQPQDAGTQGPPGIRHTVSGQTVRFEPIGEIRPASKLHYLVQAKATAAGKTKVVARLRSKNQPQELSRQYETEVGGG